ncbi:MAG: hypothetical protein WDM76_00485 [Limisphaerales bacterium]
MFGIVVAVLVFPLILRWHYPLMFLSWNANAHVFFLPGSPLVVLAAVALSLGISIVERAMNKDRHFISVPQITWPLIFFVVVVVVTAKLTGGFGLRSFGGEVYGGRKYINLLLAIAAYFAMTARHIPLRQARLYAGLLFLGGLFQVIGDLYSFTPMWMNFIYWVFQANSYVEAGMGNGSVITRFGGVTAMAVAVSTYMYARYGLRGIFLAGKPWRWMLLLVVSVCALFGGFRVWIAVLAGMFALQFYLDGLHRTKLLPIFAITTVLGLAIVIPFASHLPYTFQRALSFLPLNVNSVATMDAQGSAEWRFLMWKALWPQVPQYLLLGKGYAFDRTEYLEMGRDTAFKSYDPGEQALALAGDYHNGPLSLILPFGIWGMIAFVWFVVVAIKVLYRNHKYGDPALKTINTLLLAAFITRTLVFFFIGGGVSTDMWQFVSWLGLSVAINGGVCSPAGQPVVEKAEHQPLPFRRPQFQPAFQRFKN